MLTGVAKIRIIQGLEPVTEGILRVHFAAEHPRQLKPTWNGNSIAHWEGGTFVVDTAGYNALTWLGDDREPHSTELHVVERMRRRTMENFCK